MEKLHLAKVTKLELEDYVKVDMHTHTSGVSLCSTVNISDYVEIYKKMGTVVLTNHYSRMYFSTFSDVFSKQIERFMSEFDAAHALGQKSGLNVILAAEVAISTPQSPYIEFLLYGATREFFMENPRLYDCSQAELYRICNDNGVLMYQSHPFRNEQGHLPLDPEFMDGTEINCHKNFLRRADQVLEWADKHKLALVCGSDFHYASQAGSAGVLLPKTITDSLSLADYLRKNPRPVMFY